MGSRSDDLGLDSAAIAAVVTALGPAVSREVLAQLEAWLGELVRWNKTHDLTAARSKDELADLMLADACVLARELPPGASVVDVGSGAGAPGLPLALMRPDLVMTLVEPLTKRASFLRLVLANLGRLDVTLEVARGEAIGEARFDVAISRATLAPEAWLALGSRLVKPGGEVGILLAREGPPAASMQSGVELIGSIAYEWPTTHAARTLVRYRAA